MDAALSILFGAFDEFFPPPAAGFRSGVAGFSTQLNLALKQPPMKLHFLCLPVTALFLTSCYVPTDGYDGGYAYGGGGYYQGYPDTYGGGYYSGGHYHSGHGHTPPNRPFGKPWSVTDDARYGANHSTSSAYRDPHNGGISHNHDANGNRVDSRGHRVDDYGNHIGGGSGSWGSHSSGSGSWGSRGSGGSGSHSHSGGGGSGSSSSFPSSSRGGERSSPPPASSSGSSRDSGGSSSGSSPSSSNSSSGGTGVKDRASHR